MTNQSELESDIEMLLLRVYNGEYDRSASQTLADVKKRIVSLITADYTPNSQVADKVNTAVATRELELDHQWSKELERAVLRGKIEMLNNLDKLHARTYHQTVTDNMGKVYVDESHGYISKYETQEMIARLEAELKKTGGTDGNN